MRGETPLVYAAAHSQAVVARLLVEAGADPRAPGRDGRSAVDAAVDPVLKLCLTSVAEAADHADAPLALKGGSSTSSSGVVSSASLDAALGAVTTITADAAGLTTSVSVRMSDGAQNLLRELLQGGALLASASSSSFPSSAPPLSSSGSGGGSSGQKKKKSAALPTSAGGANSGGGNTTSIGYSNGGYFSLRGDDSPAAAAARQERKDRLRAACPAATPAPVAVGSSVLAVPPSSSSSASKARRSVLPPSAPEEDAAAPPTNAAAPAAALAANTNGSSNGHGTSSCTSCGKGFSAGCSPKMCGACAGAGAGLGDADVLYCSQECQRKHWPVHKRSCRGRTKKAGDATAAAATIPLST